MCTYITTHVWSLKDTDDYYNRSKGRPIYHSYAQRVRLLPLIYDVYVYYHAYTMCTFITTQVWSLKDTDDYYNRSKGLPPPCFIFVYSSILGEI